MRGSRIADTVQLRIMTEVVDAYCTRHAIVAEPERRHVAMNVLTLFDAGVADHEGLLTGLESLLRG